MAHRKAKKHRKARRTKPRDHKKTKVPQRKRRRTQKEWARLKIINGIWYGKYRNDKYWRRVFKKGHTPTRFGILTPKQYRALEIYNRALGQGKTNTLAMLITHGLRKQNVEGV